MPQIRPNWGHSSRHITMPAAISSRSQLLCCIFHLNSHRQRNQSWSHSRLQANIWCSCVCSLQERTFSSPWFTSYPVFPHWWYGHFHSSRLDTLTLGLCQFTPIWHFFYKYPQTPALSEHGRPPHFTAVLLFNTSQTSYTGSQSALWLTSKLPLCLLAIQHTFVN